MKTYNSVLPDKIETIEKQATIGRFAKISNHKTKYQNLIFGTRLRISVGVTPNDNNRLDPFVVYFIDGICTTKINFDKYFNRLINK